MSLLTLLFVPACVLSILLTFLPISVLEAQQSTPRPEVLHARATAAYARGDYQGALVMLRKALQRYQAFGNRQGESEVLNNIGVIYHRLAQPAQALQFYQQALAIKHELGERRQEGSSLNNIGAVYDQLGQHDKALEFYHRALAIRRELHDRQGQGEALNNIGVVHHHLGRYAEALVFYQQARTLYTTLGDQRREGGTLANIAEAYDYLGQPTKALEFYQQALTLQEQVLGPEHPDVALTLRPYAALLRKLDRNTEAAQLEARVAIIQAQQETQKPPQ